MEKARRLMQRLTDIGCRFSLDDFGVGFSSFNYLKHFPVTYIKIDGSFVENMTQDATDEAMVRSIAQIAKALGKKVIAEFVQDDATIELLKQFKVDYVQGHHLGMPASTIPHRRFARAAADSIRKKGQLRGN
jgi:EAL domain-containing protein (putative c-di-GMP-specific phosphodiesterase class I)